MPRRALSNPTPQQLKHREAANRWAAKNRVSIRGYYKTYYEQNKEAINKRRRERRREKKATREE
jgi:hypothetical protein